MAAVYAVVLYFVIVWIWGRIERPWMDDTTAVNPYQEDQR